MKLMLLVGAGAALALAPLATAGLLTPVALSASATGSISDLGVIADGIVPPETTDYTSDLNYWWENISGHWVQLDFGAAVTLVAVRASVDNNDSYLFEISTDGAAFATLFTFAASDGNVDEFDPGGMDTMSTLVGAPDFVAGTAFASVTARYLRVTAVSGDNLYAVGEILAWDEATPVPEPATWAAMAGAAALALAWARRR